MHENKTNMIEMPESIRESLSIPVRDMGGAALSVVVHERPDQPDPRGRYGIAPVPVRKPAGIPIEFPGHDTFTRQARTAGGSVVQSERPTEISPEEV